MHDPDTTRRCFGSIEERAVIYVLYHGTKKSLRSLGDIVGIVILQLLKDPFQRDGHWSEFDDALGRFFRELSFSLVPAHVFIKP